MIDCGKCLSKRDCHTECQGMKDPVTTQSLLYRLRKRAEIRRQIADRKSVQEGRADRIADLLEEAANEIDKLEETVAVFVAQRLE